MIIATFFGFVSFCPQKAGFITISKVSIQDVIKGLFQEFRYNPLRIFISSKVRGRNWSRDGRPQVQDLL